jgi:hypothetical protein
MLCSVHRYASSSKLKYSLQNLIPYWLQLEIQNIYQSFNISINTVCGYKYILAIIIKKASLFTWLPNANKYFSDLVRYCSCFRLTQQLIQFLYVFEPSFYFILWFFNSLSANFWAEKQHSRVIAANFITVDRKKLRVASLNCNNLLV